LVQYRSKVGKDLGAEQFDAVDGIGGIGAWPRHPHAGANPASARAVLNTPTWRPTSVFVGVGAGHERVPDPARSLDGPIGGGPDPDRRSIGLSGTRSHRGPAEGVPVGLVIDVVLPPQTTDAVDHAGQPLVEGHPEGGELLGPVTLADGEGYRPPQA